MTVGELERLFNSKKRVEKIKAQEKASFDYILADLIGRSIGRIYSSNTKMPSIEEVYPNIFNEVVEERKEEEQERQAELSVIRFRQFADSFNKNFKEVANDK